MKPIERVTIALQHKEPDRVPVYPILSGVTRKLTGAGYKEWTTNADTCAEALIKAADEFGLDVICTLTDLSVEAADYGQKIVYPENEAAHPDLSDHLIKSIEDYDKLPEIDPRRTPRMSEHIKLCDLLVKAKGAEIPVVAFIFGPLGILSMLRGQQDLYMDMYDDPEAVKRVVEKITDMLVDYSDALMDTGIHAIMIDTLFASQSIMSKQMWLEFEGVCVERLARHIHDRGCMVMIHNCGAGIYFDVQIQTMKPEAISFLHIPDDCTSYEEAKEKYGSVTTLIGCISPTWLAEATPDEVAAESRKHIDMFGKGGGFILSTGCEYPANIPFDNAKAIVETAREYGKY